MSEEREDRLIEAALGENPGRDLAPEERREAERLKRAFLSLSDGTDPVAPPARAKERLMAGVRADVRRRALAGRLAWAASFLVLAGSAAFFLGRAPAARVADLAGDVFLDGKRLGAGDAVPAGATVETAPGAWVNLRLGGRATVRLREGAGQAAGARLTLFRLGREVELRLNRGALFSHVRTGTRFSVRTPAAVAAVRGTVFYVQVESADRTYLCLCQGKLHVDGRGKTRDLEAAHHAGLWAGPAGLEDGPMLGHTDEEGAALSLLP